MSSMTLFREFFAAMLQAVAKLLPAAYTKARTRSTMSELNKHLETIKGPLLTAGIASAIGAITFKADQYFGSKSAHNEHGPDLDLSIIERPNATKTLVLLGGLCMNGEELAAQYQEELAGDVNLISPVYDSNGFDGPSLFEQLYEQLDRSPTDDIVIAGLSMGGLIAWDWLDYGIKNGKQDITDKVSHVILRGVPVSPKSIRPGPRLLLNTVQRLGYSYALDHSRPLLKRWNCVSLLKATPAAIVEQCRYLAGPHTSNFDFSPDKVTFVRGALPDPVVDEQIAINTLQQRLSRPINEAIDTDHMRPTHAPIDTQSVRFMLAQLGIAKHQYGDNAADNQPLHTPNILPAAA